MKFLKKIKEFLLNFLNLTKLFSNVKNIAIVLLAFYLSGSIFNLHKIFLGVISLSFISSAIYIYNNFSDLKSDKYNKNKDYYSEAVKYFGEKNTLVLNIIFIVLGLYFGSTINFYFLFALIALFIIGFLYSFKYTRFKEKVILDILFGATLTFLFRFIAFWFIFSISLPPILAVIALVSAKSAGYMLYKEVDRPYLTALKIKNSITIASKKTIITISSLLWFISFLSFIFLCLNSRYFQIEYLGKLPLNFLFLIPLAAPPLAVIYLSALNKIKTQIKYLRILGFCYWTLIMIIVWILLI
ncbi:MAG: UbiA family prenyltransferase [Candidatus Staskawiczbacteria bacterium]|nr:UbiA family prenyltransferase [Candidatus Staskawiczbacteria bacterium]